MDLEIVGMCVTSLEPLSHLLSLRRLWLIGDPGTGSDAVLDLSQIAGLQQLEELRLAFSGSVSSVRPLLGMPRLHDIRLRGTGIADGDASPLETLAAAATVVFPKD
jgi:hypothetical protein